MLRKQVENFIGTVSDFEFKQACEMVTQVLKNRLLDRNLHTSTFIGIEILFNRLSKGDVNHVFVEKVQGMGWNQRSKGRISNVCRKR